VATIVQLNVAIYALTLAAAWWAARDPAAPRAGRWALCLLLTSAPLADYGVRLYAEALTTLLAVVALGALLRLHRDGRARHAVLLGAAAGAMLLTKHSALALLAVLPIVALATARDRANPAAGARTRGLLLATALATAIALPFWIRNARLFGAPFYPAGAHDADPYMLRLLATNASLKALLFVRALAAATGPFIAFAAALACIAAARARRLTPAAATIGVACVLGALALLEPLSAPRHLYPLVAAVAVAGAIGSAQALATKPRAPRAADVCLLAAALVSVAAFANPRPHFDARPDVVVAAHAIARIVPEHERVLGVWTYDTAWHTGRPATWPIAWGQTDRPLVPFTATDCDTIAAAFAAHGVGWALVPNRPPLAPDFDGTNYPAPLMRCLADRVVSGRSGIAWRSADWTLIRLAR